MKTRIFDFFKTPPFTLIAVIGATACLNTVVAAQSNQYQVAVQPANIALTAATKAGSKVEVFGQPRMTKGHPCTLWDQEDIAHYKEVLKTSKELQDQVTRLKAAMDKRIEQPIGVPETQKGADGQWMFPGFIEKYKKPGDKWGYAVINGIHQHLSSDIADLGEAYALTGDAKYGEYCKKLLLAYAYAYPRWGTPSGKREMSGVDRMSPQFLDDAMWLIKVAFGYDLIYNLPSITPEERKQIQDDLLKAVAQHNGINKYLYINPTNWSAIVCCSILTAGYACDDQSLVDEGLYGQKGTKEKPTGGLIGLHFTDKCIGADGLWAEGSMAYQFMAGGVLIDTAEMLWHHGVDMYRYRDGILKRLFDSPLLFTYPDFSSPAFHDSHRSSLANEFGINTYEYAYRRYRDPSYLPILSKLKKSLNLGVHSSPPSFLYDLKPGEKSQSTTTGGVNFSSAGYGMLRITENDSTNMLTLLYGSTGSHSHPDKLSIDLFALNDTLIPDTGAVFPYSDPINTTWNWTTLGHCALVVDEKSQPYFHANPNEIKEGTEMAPQLVFGPASTIGMQRAVMDTKFTGASQDRSVFLTPQYMADLFGAYSSTPHKYDMAWHIRGSFASDLRFEPMKFSDPVPNGYNALSNLRHSAPTDKAWSATITREGRTARLLAAGSGPTEIIVGEGHYKESQVKDEPVPTILERRTQSSTVYGNVLDISGTKDGYVKNITQEGGIESGYGLLKVETIQGVDLCFTSYRSGIFKAGGWETDAVQAFVLMDGKNVRALYLGGGKMLKTVGATLERSEPGLAYVERTKTGAYILANPSPTEATVTITLPALQQMSAFNLDDNGRRTGAATIKSSSPSSFAVQLKAASKVEFAHN